MPETFRVNAGKQELDLEVVEGTEGERGIDIANLRDKTGLVTLDPAFMNTASTKSAITFLDGEQGHPPLPRHPHRAAGRAERVRRDGVPAHLRPPAHAGRADAVLDACSPATR